MRLSPATSSGTHPPSHLSRGRPRFSMPKCAAIMASQGCGTTASSSFAQAQLERQHPERAAAKERQRAMRRNGPERFGVGVVVAELLFFGDFLALHDRRRHDALVPHARAQLRRAGPRFRRSARPEFRARRRAPLSRPARRSPRRRRLNVDSTSPLPFRDRASDRRTAHRPAAPVPLRARSAPGCGVWACTAGRGLPAPAWSRRFDGRAQLGGELALLLDRLEDRRAPLFQFAQIEQPLFQVRNCVSSRLPVASLR